MTRPSMSPPAGSESRGRRVLDFRGPPPSLQDGKEQGYAIGAEGAMEAGPCGSTFPQCAGRSPFACCGRRFPSGVCTDSSGEPKKKKEAGPPSLGILERATGLEPTRRSVLAAVGVRPLARATAPTVPGAGLSPGVVALRTLPPRSRSRGNASACPALLDPFAFESAETRKGGTASLFGFSGAGDGSRTRDLKLGKLALYRLSYARADQNDSAEAEPGSRPPETPPRGAPPLRGRAGIGTMRWCPARRDGEPE